MPVTESEKIFLNQRMRPLTLAPRPRLAPVMMTTLPAIDSSGLLGSIDGYWTRETRLVNCALVTK